MGRIHLTVQDLLRCRFIADPAPMVELVVALMTLRRRDAGLFDQWRHLTRPAFRRAARPLLELVFADSGPEYLDSLTPGFAAGVDEVLSSPPSLVRQSFDDPDTAHHPVTPWLRQLADGDREAQQVLRHALHAAHDTLI